MGVTKGAESELSASLPIPPSPALSPSATPSSDASEDSDIGAPRFRDGLRGSPPWIDGSCNARNSRDIDGGAAPRPVIIADGKADDGVDADVGRDRLVLENQGVPIPGSRGGLPAIL